MNDRKPSAAQLRQLRKDNALWPPALERVPQEQWPAEWFTHRNAPKDAWRSRQFLVQLFNDGGHIRLSVNRTEWDERRGSWREDISWDDLQRLKAEAGFADRWAIECFPPDAAVVNVANMRHIWLLHETPPFGWHGKSGKPPA